MITNELICDEEFVQVSMPNTVGLTTEQVLNKPILDEKRRKIGHLTEADEDFIYGVVYSPSSLYKDPSPASVEIVLETK